MATDTGHKRAHNEDSMIAAPTVFSVADGMGGHAAGDLASKAVVTRLSEKAANGVMSAEGVMEALVAATVDISHAVDEHERGVGTTATGIALTLHGRQPHWVVFNVGDSRVYLFERNVLTQLTVDHSVVQELVSAGLISADDAEHHPDSSVVTRAVGFNAEPVPDFRLIPVTIGSRILVCSDGLTREVGDLELSRHLSGGLGSEETAHALVDAALAEGGRDNVTVIVIDVLR
ncbi:MAG: serine/threonine-protein phosphatase [Microbacteriaceae bacterium]|nr:serine/threonine-protein phosphatase [Microbacteriaceae bacterium]